MKGFTWAELAMSLCCPLLSFLWGILRILTDLMGGADFLGGGLLHTSCVLAILAGGIIPAILTLAMKVHTEEYLKKRLITISVVYVLNSCIGKIGIPIIMFALYMLVGVTAVIFQILKVQDNFNTACERTVMIMSDPIVYWTIYWFLFWVLKGF